MGERRGVCVTESAQICDEGFRLDRADNEVTGDGVVGASDLAGLLDRVRNGDRTATAELIGRYGPRIRRRIRGKLPADMRRLFDSQDILSTVARRLDIMVAFGKLNASSNGQVWNLVDKIAEHSLIEKARAFRTQQAREGSDGPAAEYARDRSDDAQRAAPDDREMDLNWALGTAGDRVDREILSLWLKGNEPTTIAAAVEMPPATVRKRWERIRGRLKLAYLSEEE